MAEENTAVNAKAVDGRVRVTITAEDGSSRSVDIDVDAAGKFVNEVTLATGLATAQVILSARAEKEGA